MKQTPYIVIVALALLSGWLFTELRKSQAENNRKDTIISEKQDSLRYERTVSGRLRIEKAAAVTSAKEFHDAYPKLAAELKREFDVKVRDLKAYVKAEFEARGEGTGSISNTYYVDSTGHRYKEFTMDDGYLRFRTTLFDSLTKAPYRYTYQDTLTYGFKTEKKWLLGKERLYGFGGLRNPNAKITKATNVLIDDYKDKRWVVVAGAAYNPFAGKIIPMVGVGYALFKF